MKATWFFRSFMRLLTGVAESMRTLVLTPALMISRISHEYPIIAQLVVLDDRQGLERLSETDAVCDDAAVVLLDLVDRAQHAVALEAIELAPDERFLDARAGLDDLVLFQLAQVFAEDVVEG